MWPEDHALHGAVELGLKAGWCPEKRGYLLSVSVFLRSDTHQGAEGQSWWPCDMQPDLDSHLRKF